MVMIYTSLNALIILTLLTLFTLCIQRQHFLISLLALEATILTLVILSISNVGSEITTDLFYVLIILTFGACEARLGLALLVSITRIFGSDLVKSLAINKC